MVLGIVALVMSFVPFVGVVAWPLLVLGLIFGGVGVAKALDGAAPRGKAIAGLACSGVALVVCLGWVAFFAALGSKSTAFPESFGQSPSRNQTVAFGQLSRLGDYEVVVGNARKAPHDMFANPNGDVWLADATLQNDSSTAVNPDVEASTSATTSGRSANRQIAIPGATPFGGVGEIPPGAKRTWTLAFDGGAEAAHTVQESLPSTGSTVTWS